jgi:hypothetical protein
LHYKIADDRLKSAIIVSPAMTLLAPQPSLVPTLPPVPVRRFSVDEYHRMIEGGFFADDEGNELLEGWIIPKMARDARHDATIELADDTLSKILPEGWRVRVQSAVTTGDSEPEPDLALVKGSPRARAKQHPGSAEVPLLIEVAESSLNIDRRLKGRIYARAQFVEYWIINLVENQIEVYTDPVADVIEPFYRGREVYGRGQTIAFTIEGTRCQVATDDLLTD